MQSLLEAALICMILFWSMSAHVDDQIQQGHGHGRLNYGNTGELARMHN